MQNPQDTPYFFWNNLRFNDKILHFDQQLLDICQIDYFARGKLMMDIILSKRNKVIERPRSTQIRIQSLIQKQVDSVKILTSSDNRLFAAGGQ